MCWPENDASEKNKAKTGELSKSNVCNSSAAGSLWRQRMISRISESLAVPMSLWQGFQILFKLAYPMVLSSLTLLPRCLRCMIS